MKTLTGQSGPAVGGMRCDAAGSRGLSDHSRAPASRGPWSFVEVLTAIRALDEVDVSRVEPMTIFPRGRDGGGPAEHSRGRRAMPKCIRSGSLSAVEVMTRCLDASGPVGRPAQCFRLAQ